MIKVITSMLLTVCVCLPSLHAREMAGPGWGTSAPRQRSASAVSMTATESVSDSSRSSRATLIPAVMHHESGDESRPPFPVLTPKVIVYPRKAVRRGWEGRAVVAAEVLPDGSVGRTALAKTSGHDVLDKAAEDAIRSWKFGTDSKKDEAVPQFVDIPVTFKLQKEV